MAITDYIPNIFGQAPVSYQGLLGAGLITPEQLKQTQSRANIQGLLGAGLALAQGMSNIGPRRSAAENILTALSGGMAAGGGAFDQSLKNIAAQQQLLLQGRQMSGVQAMKAKYPDLADEFDANPAGAFRLVAEREALAKRPTAISAGQTLVDPTGKVIFQAPSDKKKNTAVIGNVLVDLETGQPIYTAPEERKPTGKVLSSSEAQALGLPSGVIYQQTSTGEVKPVEGTGAKAPEVRDFNDGTTRQYDPATQSWKVLARKPQGEGKTMYASTPTVDGEGRLVFLPTKPGMPVLDAATGKPVDYVAKVSTKPMPATLQKGEEEDFDAGQAAIDLANDSQNYLNNIAKGNIKFGVGTKIGLSVMSALGSSDPDVVARNEFERFKTNLINESLRLNKGTQTDNDAKRAVEELRSAESAADAGAAIQRLRDINIRRALNSNTSIIRRRANAKVGDPEITLDVPKFEPYVFTNADYAKVKPGQTFVDSEGVRRIKPKDKK